jgi:hypothetical protein
LKVSNGFFAAAFAAVAAISASIAGAIPAAAEDIGVADIIKKLEANQVYDTSSMDAKLAVTNRFGVTSNEFTVYSRKGGDTLVVITAGPDRGQKVLRQKKDIYLYYPDAEDVIWLKGSALKDSMMGSDFSYEDLTDDGTILGRYDAELLGSETFDGAKCWRIMLTAKTKNETYAKQEILVDAATFVTRHAILYSAAGKPIREMSASDVRTVAGKNIPFTSVMKDLMKKNSSTEMKLTRVEIGIPLSGKYFNREELSW